jgi:hypothetical protein
MLPPSLDRFRPQLERAVAADLARRRRRRIGGVVAAVAVVLVVVNLLPSGKDRPGGVAPASAVERAAAALEPEEGTILHIHMKGRQFEEGRSDIHWEDESWALIGTDRRRSIQTQPFGPVAEMAYGDGVQSLWDGERVLEKPAPREGGVNAPGGAFRDEALKMLKSPRAKVTRDRDRLRITSKATMYVVDGKSYVPLELRTFGTSGGTELRFVAYESLPLNEETEKLLSIAAQHRGAPVVRDAAAYDAAVAKLFPNG